MLCPLPVVRGLRAVTHAPRARNFARAREWLARKLSGWGVTDFFVNTGIGLLAAPAPQRVLDDPIRDE